MYDYFVMFTSGWLDQYERSAGHTGGRVVRTGQERGRLAWCRQLALRPGQGKTNRSYTPDDPPENCHLTVKKLPKTWLFFQKKLPKIFFTKIANGNLWKKKSSFWQFFDSQIALFRRVRSRFDWQIKKQANWNKIYHFPEFEIS